jgi:hypothetical protein
MFRTSTTGQSFLAPVYFARLLGRRLWTSLPRGPWLAKARVTCLAIRHQFRIDLRQRLAGPRRLRRALHDGMDAVYPQACTLATGASNESRTLTGGEDLCARPLVTGHRGDKRYRQPDTEHTEPADWHYVVHHHRSRLSGSGQIPLSRAALRGGSCIALTWSTVRNLTMRDEGDRLVAGMPLRRHPRGGIWPTGHRGSVRLCDGHAGRPRCEAPRRSAGGDTKKPRAHIDQLCAGRRANPQAGDRAAPDVWHSAYAVLLSSSRSTRLSTLPDGLRGRLSRRTSRSGTLKPARCARQCAASEA